MQSVLTSAEGEIFFAHEHVLYCASFTELSLDACVFYELFFSVRMNYRSIVVNVRQQMIRQFKVRSKTSLGLKLGAKFRS